MKTRQTKVVDSGWMIAALVLVLILLVPVSGAQAQKCATYRVNGEALTAPEQYVLAQTEKGKVADLSALLPDQNLRGQIGKLGLGDYVEQLPEEERKGFLKKNTALLRLRGPFLEALLVDGFPDFKIHRHGVRIFNAIIVEPLDFGGAEVKQPFWLADSVLAGKANLRDSWFKQNLVLSGMLFLQEANFERIKVGKSIFLQRTSFYGPVVFRLADIGVSLEADGAKFLDKEQTANFDNLKVGQTVSLEKAEFQGRVNFRGAVVGNQFIADGARFLSEKYAAIFNGLKVGQSAFFNNATFQGPVNFISANIGDEFYANQTKFSNKTETASFEKMKVSKTTFFVKAIFQGPVDFLLAQTGMNFLAQGAQFLNKEQSAYFSSMNVGSNGRFEGATFQGTVDLSYSSFNGLEFNKVNCPNIMVEGMTYKKINCGPDWHGPLKLLEKSAYSAQPYRQLATFFQESGYPERADEVFIAGKRRELRQKAWWNPATWFTFIFWDLLTGYGRAPMRSFGLGLVIILLGAIFIFDPRYLKLKVIDAWNLDYDLKLRPANKITNFVKVGFLRFMISFDQFIPAINLGLAPHWEPEALSFRKWFFAYLQRISGWILIPIGLAAIASQFK